MSPETLFAYVLDCFACWLYDIVSVEHIADIFMAGVRTIRNWMVYIE
jgi:hypothetical protein